MNSLVDKFLKVNRCKKCGTKNSKKDKYCKNCGENLWEDSTVRKQEFAGVILKCPNCGEVLSNFVAFCPTCGHEITKSENESSIKKFTNKLSEMDSKVEKSSKKKTKNKIQGFWWIFLNVLTLFIPMIIQNSSASSKADKELRNKQRNEKTAFIKNFIFDNDRSTIIEALIYVNSQMTTLNDLSLKEAKYWFPVWKSKATELFNKAQALFPNDKVVLENYNSVVAQSNQIKKRERIRILIIVVVVVVVVAISYLIKGE